MLSLSVVIAVFGFPLNQAFPGAIVRCGRSVGKRLKFAPAGPAFAELIGATIPASVAVIKSKKQAGGLRW
jgi:hypothetical protein